ncbi:uncharacterized protein N7506_000748 [Penicillium brevicompactum]|uniref:uncharacterized protein n=1 Tax=Penicillium brevicompactum TaxID=5074 RepID=UPI002540615B|nr:uncharacterized protein N7506_000748 [Penicillium brevicompactum]KAJ5347495.1 hypothetical protein N7506_000748 [Penicillium brevicompactum]
MSDVDQTYQNYPAGLLTQPLVSSPMTSWILPARIRHKNHNDVVFVGDRGIQIREAFQSGHLEDVVEKNDIQGLPLGAKVINVSTQLPWETQLSSDTPSPPQSFEDLPPHILFIATDANELHFMYWSLLKGQFVSFCRRLPRDVNISEKYGTHIAVDPKSRAVAVSASRNFFAVFWLDDTIEIKRQMAHGGLDPIRKEKFVQVEGDILFMEFLYPKALNDKRMLLLLIVHRENATIALVYEWDERSMTRNSDPTMTRTLFPPQDYLPTMIVPLAKESSYLVITTKSMAMYTPNSSSRPRRYPPIIPDIGAHEIGLWTRWARPSRNWLYSRKYDAIILCREDGWIYYLEFGNDGELETQTSLGQLHCHVDTAFDVLDMGFEGGDFILAAGSQGDGGLFVQEARDRPRCVQRFANWAPVTDAVAVPSGIRGTTGLDTTHDRLFVCSSSASGKSSASGNGAITELRHGIEARVGVSISLGDISSVHDMWALSFEDSLQTILVVSDPISSMILHTSDLADDIEVFPNEDAWGNEETLAVGCTPRGDIVQITQRGIYAFMPEESHLSHFTAHAPDSVVTAATVDGSNVVMAMAIRTSEGNFLQVVRLNPDLATADCFHFDMPQPLEQEAISIFYQRWGSMGLIFMGTSDGTLLSFEIHDSPGESKRLADTHIAVETDEDVSKAISSIATIRAMSNTNNIHGRLFCGLRSGILVFLEMRFLPNGLEGLTQISSKRLGQTAIRLQAQEDIALFTCGTDLWRVAFSPDLASLDYTLSRVFITDQNQPAYAPTNVSSFSFVNISDQNSRATGVSLFCWADGNLLGCSLDVEDKPIPRRIDVPGNPNKLTYSEHLRSLIVSYSVAQPGQESPLNLIRKPYIEFVDPDIQTPVAPIDEQMVAEGLAPWRPSGSPGEKVTCIFDWMPQKDGNAYHLVVIGTSVPTPHNPAERTGRILLLQASRDPRSPSQVTCVDKHMKLCAAPVTAMTAYADSLIAATGRSFLALASKNSQIDWVRNITARLPSPAVSMSVHGNFIHVTTARDSLLVCKVEGGDISIVDSNCFALPGLSHLLAPGLENCPTQVFVSSRGGTVQVFEPDSVSTASENRRTLRFPVSILRLVQGCKPPSSLTSRRTIYGFAINGSVYRVVTLTPDELAVLEPLIFLCMSDKRLCPSLARRNRFRTAFADCQSNGHIDGSIIARLLTLDCDTLKDMILNCSSGGDHDGQSSLTDRFAQAAFNLLGPSDDYPRAVFSWLWNVLRVEF